MTSRSSISHAHPGMFVRDIALPKGMSVTQAAKLLDVGRPALSNLLNGNAALSSEMAARIERAFGVSARKLMDMQAAYDAQIANEKGAASSTKAYVPPFLQLKANDIEEWASSISARNRLAVFLRTLVNSTGLKLGKVEFPGNDNAERPGWDGFVEAGEGTPWVPLGKSGWEFGVSRDPKQKADGDYAKSVAQVPREERTDTAFVFVTPTRWPGKSTWENERRAERNWKDVRVLDASNLEEWLEQSIPAQAWLANERGLPSQGVHSLDACWTRWAADCKPLLSESLFDTAVESTKLVVTTRLSTAVAAPLVVSADSIEEALAFLHCLFSPGDPKLSAFRDRVIVFSEPGTLAKLASKSAQFIAVVISREVERELAQFTRELRSVIVYPRNATNADPDIMLEPLNYEAFEKSLLAMGCNRDEIHRLARESGRSLTVLRRRLSKLEAIRTPAWSANTQAASSLIPFLFAGAWKATNEADQIILTALAGDTRYSELESRLTTLLPLDDAPVWSIGSFRGVISKIDALFAINKNISAPDIKRFFGIAELVLSEDDPSLDLPEEDRWAAGVHGKTREISAALREGVSETLVLLAVHGNSLFRERIGVDLELEVGRLIRSLLTPLSTRTLEAHSGDLPMYAEMAPDEFLQILERDLETPTPQTLGLMRPASAGTFGRCPRTGLLWALENIAWSREHLVRTMLVLARLAETVIDDNWANKPSASLSAIFRCWMPQTAASVEARIAALDLLADRFPKVAWRICVEQFEGGSQTGTYSHKPRWRTDGHGYGEPVMRGEAHRFAVHALELAIAWKSHDHETLGDLVGCVVDLDDKYQNAIWKLVAAWGNQASDQEKAKLREKIRISAFTRRGLQRGKRSGKGKQTIDRARQAYDALVPADIILKHEWLFRKQWVDESMDEIEDESFDFRKRNERITALRSAALTEIVSERGLNGVLSLAEMGEGSNVIGCLFPRLFDSVDTLIDALQLILDRGALSESLPRRMLMAGALGSLPNETEPEILRKLLARLDASNIVPVFVLCPFREVTWNLLKSIDQEIQAAYWRQVNPNWPPQSEPEAQFAIEKLLEADRPRAAFHLARFDLKHLQPKLLYRVMRAIVSSSREAPGTYRFNAHELQEAFELLNQSGEIAVDQMAGLEFQYTHAFDYEAGRIPNLEKQIEAHPELFVQAVAFAFKRSDDGQDPKEFQVSDPEQLGHRALAAYKLLERLSRIPGHNRLGELDPQEIEKWVSRVRSACRELAREEPCDHALGKLFSTAPVGKDGIWPCEPVRDALEKIATDTLSRSVKTGLYNSRGVHWRGEGGEQERELAKKYETWAQALEFTHPRVSKILKNLVETYRHEANWEDTEAGIRKRLRY